MPTLPVGTYQVTCESPGFKRSIVTGIVLQVDERRRVDVELEAGTPVQTVEVSATARLIETHHHREYCYTPSRVAEHWSLQHP